MENLNQKEIIQDYLDGMGAEKIALKYHIGKLKVNAILDENGIPRKKKGGQKLKIDYVVPDWRIDKYPPKEGYHYVAIFREDGTRFNGHQNQGGFLTSYISEKVGIEIPTLYDRRKYYMMTGNYWWEQWFDIVLEEDKPVKKCPYCNWETVDIDNRSGAFEVHLREAHNMSKFDYIKEHPEDKPYFELVNPTKNLQMSDNANEFVVCAVCGKKLARLDTNHLNLHNLTKAEYISLYGFDTVSSKYHNAMRNIAIKNNMSMEFHKHSSSEIELMRFIKSLGFECRSDRRILAGKEIDILIPSANLAIELNGNRFHTERYGGKDKHYHIDKTNMCKRHGINLIHIFEDEFVRKKDIVLSKIKHLLKADNDLPKVYGRKCEIREISLSDAKSFLEKYHIQGHVNATIYYGAFANDKLIAVMSFKIQSKDCWELVRFASDYHYVCCGVGGKIFKKFVTEQNPFEIKSFADRRWTINEKSNLYIQLGFDFCEYTKPEYRYYNNKVDKYTRFHKFGFRKSKLIKKYPKIVSPNMTETEMAKALGYDRIWDCGLIKYVWKRPLIQQ